jgi:hypothetical protein
MRRMRYDTPIYLFDWDKKFHEFRNNHIEIFDVALNDITLLSLELDIIAEVNASLMMMYKECRALYKQEFLDIFDFVHIYNTMELSVNILIVILNEIEYDKAMYIYNTFVSSLGDLKDVALQHDLFEISQNIFLFREYFIDCTFNFDTNTFKKK